MTMRKIRRGVFETNSSSTHSISFGWGERVNTERWKPIDGAVTVYTSEYGWEIEEYNDPQTKASYALTWAATYGNGSPELMRILEAAIKRGLGEDVRVDLEYRESGGWGDNGYIDHQSQDVGAEAFRDVETMYRFIFDENCVLRTDNDNH